MDLRLLSERFERSDDGTATISRWYANGAFECFGLEDAVREPAAGRPSDPAAMAAWVRAWKIPRVTAIPAGIYDVVIDRSPLFSARATERFFKQHRDANVKIDILTPHLLNVPAYDGIRIHPGVKAEDTDGCLCPGRTHTAGQALIGESRLAMIPLLQKIEEAQGLERLPAPDVRIIPFLRHWAYAYRQVAEPGKVRIEILNAFLLPQRETVEGIDV